MIAMLNSKGVLVVVAAVVGITAVLWVSQKPSQFGDRSPKAVVKLEATTPLRARSPDEVFADESLRRLAKSAANGDVEEIQKLLSAGVDLNAGGALGATPLFFAFRSGNLVGYNALLVEGANPNAIFEDGDSVMHMAAREGEAEFLHLALMHGGDVNLVGGDRKLMSPLHRAITYRPGRDDLDRVLMLINAGADLQYRRADGVTPLESSIRLGRFDLAYALIKAGATDSVNEIELGQLRAAIDERASRMNQDHVLYEWYQNVVELLDTTHGS